MQEGSGVSRPLLNFVVVGKMHYDLFSILFNNSQLTFASGIETDLAADCSFFFPPIWLLEE